MTLSSRLRSSQGGRGSLQDLEETINPTGKRRIAKLELSIADPDVLANQTPSTIAPAEKVTSNVSRQDSEDADNDLIDFDIDVFTKDYRIGAKSQRKKEHIFGRVETYRGQWDVLSADGVADPHDRFNEGPALQRYVAYEMTCV
jgi:hypothetical protein